MVGTMCTYAVAVYLISVDAQPRCSSAVRSLSPGTICARTPRRRCRFQLQRDDRRVHTSEATFPEGVKNKDGRGCSEEVVAKGKGHARKTGRRRRGRARFADQWESSALILLPAPPCEGDLNSSATHGRLRRMTGDRDSISITKVIIIFNFFFLYLRQRRRLCHCSLSVWVGKSAAWCIILR